MNIMKIIHKALDGSVLSKKEINAIYDCKKLQLRLYTIDSNDPRLSIRQLIALMSIIILLEQIEFAGKSNKSIIKAEMSLIGDWMMLN